MTKFDQLMTHVRTTHALAQVMGRLGWDQETMMPKGAAQQRGEEMAALESVLHARRSDPAVGEMLETVTPRNAVETAQIRHIKLSYERATKVPAELAMEIAKVTSQAQGTWADARANDDFKAFVPVLENVVALKKSEGQALAAGGDVYDAMLQDYEPGTTQKQITHLFDAMRPRLVELLEKVKNAGDLPNLSGIFAEKGQLKVSDLLAKSFGYDFSRGRIDKAVHPFSSGSGADVRITTRTNLSDPFNCFYSTIHEVGHACYEQGIDDAYALTPIGSGASMGVHESQSRIYENQLGRSHAYCGYLHDLMVAEFGDFGLSKDAFYGAVNRVSDGYIRTEADEVQYNLHVMLRYDLERAMVSGDLAVADLETAWNDRFKADFGYDVDVASNGCLQDVHWSVGLFGYFPTYTLGNVYAGNLYKALRRDVKVIDQELSQGVTASACHWLRSNLQQHGGLRAPVDTIKHACGFEPTHEPLLDYLDEKFTALYRL